MNIATDILRRYIHIEHTPAELRYILDDIGIEVKRLEDGVFGVELLANRGDHHCYYGIARELSGRLGRDICTPPVTVLESDKCGAYPVENQTDLCLLYSATVMTKKNTQAGSLSAADLHTLECAGIHSLLPPIDATNLSNLELGQPTHVFDADKVEGSIVVRQSVAGEKAWLLFEEEARDIPEGTIVIADQVKILAIAGVIGCEDSKTTAETTKIIIESACFDPVQVRKTGRALHVHTDALARFERGSDPSFVLVGAGRVVCLLQQVGWELQGKTTVVGDWTDPKRNISLSVRALQQFLGTTIDAQDIVDRLARYGFRSTIESRVDGDSIHTQVPAHRLWDVENCFDIYEEIAKSIGYNNTPISLPKIDKGAQPTELEIRKTMVEELLLGLGAYEVITDGFYGRASLEKLGLPQDHPLQQHIETLNSVDKGYSLLKNNCLLQAIEAVRNNRNRNIQDIKIFEWTRCFVPDASATNGVCREEKMLWAIFAGTESGNSWKQTSVSIDPLYVKGLVEEMRVLLRIPLEFRQSTHLLSPILHPNRQLSIWLHDRCVGVLGEVHPRICNEFKIKRVRPCYLQLDESVLLARSTGVSYTIPPVFQPLQRTVAFSVPTLSSGVSIGAQNIADVLQTVADSVSIVDLFVFEEEGISKRAITYHLSFANSTGTLSAEECNNQLHHSIQLVLEKYQSEGVRHR